MAAAKHFKELVNKNGELKKMLADEMLKKSSLGGGLKKSGKRLCEETIGILGNRVRFVFGASCVPLPELVSFELALS